MCKRRRRTRAAPASSASAPRESPLHLTRSLHHLPGHAAADDTLAHSHRPRPHAEHILSHRAIGSSPANKQHHPHRLSCERHPPLPPPLRLLPAFFVPTDAGPARRTTFSSPARPHRTKRSDPPAKEQAFGTAPAVNPHLRDPAAPHASNWTTREKEARGDS